MAHTSGRWVLNGYQVERTEGISRTIATVAPRRRIGTDYAANNADEAMANARLIAAAPYMLTILETINLHASSLNIDGIRELCRDAINEAKGKADV